MGVKVGQDSKGLFAIIYGAGGVQWVRGQRAAEIARRSGLSQTQQASGDGSLQESAAGQIVEAVARLGQWYEMRQMRLLEEARFEERRIPWFVSCANLVLNDIAANGRLDAKAAYYLSREASGLFEACENNPKIFVPGTVLYMCYGIHRHLAEFNIASNEYVSSVLSQQGALTTGSSLFGETLRKIMGDAQVPSDASWLEYHSAEEQLEAMIAFASEKKSIEVDWKDIAKSSVLLTAFIPIPVFWGAGMVARTLIAVSGMARSAAVGYSFQPLFRLVKGIFKNINDTKRIKMIEDYRDLLLLQLEAANTARFIWVQGRLLEGTEQKRLVLLGQETFPALPAPDKKYD